MSKIKVFLVIKVNGSKKIFVKYVKMHKRTKLIYSRSFKCIRQTMQVIYYLKFHTYFSNYASNLRFIDTENKITKNARSRSGKYGILSLRLFSVICNYMHLELKV